jgi:hypothetical protein
MTCEKMHMILHATGEDRRAIKPLRNAREVSVEVGAKGFIREIRRPRFGGKDDVEVNGGKGLGHRDAPAASSRSSG